MRALIAGLIERTRAHFETALDDALAAAERALLAHVEHGADDARQQRRRDDLRAIRRERRDVAPRFLRRTESSLVELRGPRRERAAAPDADARPRLALVDPAQFDDDLAVQQIVSKSEIRNSRALHALSYRLGVVAGAPALPNARLPLGPAQLASALRYALAPLGLAGEQRLLVHREFERAALLPLAPFYDAVNAYLARRRVLPNLQAHRGSRRAGPDGDAFAGAPPVRGETAAEAPAAPTPPERDAELFPLLRGLLARRRGGTDAAPAHDRCASTHDLHAVLRRLDGGGADAAAPRYDGTRLRNALVLELRRASPPGEPLQLAPEDADTIDLVGLLFDFIASQARVDAAARSLLMRLHVPILRVALDDKTFFARRDHPARRLLNTIAATGARALDAGGADGDIARKLQFVSTQIGDDGDVAAVAQLADDLDLYQQLLARRAEIAERRHVDAAKGRDRLDNARARAHAAIARALQAGRPTPLARTLLETAWTDALALSALRGGAGSSGFRRRLAVAETLAGAGASIDDAELRRELDDGLRAVGLHEDDVRRVLGELLAAPAAASSAPDRPAAGEALLRDRPRFGGESAPAPAAASPPARIPLNFAETARLRQLRTLPFGTWFEFVRNQQGERVRLKLAWYSTATGRCLFVDSLGARAEERTLEQLARDVERGRAHVAAAEPASLVDRAWDALVDALRPRDADLASGAPPA
ncbi:MAG TPA: DUF1631 family protein [Dokdonella sp.]